MKLKLPLGILGLITCAVLGSSCQPSSNGNVNSATTPAASPTAGPTGSVEKSGRKGPHCDDAPPANPANCNLNVDQPFVVGCNLPFTGQSHEIDQHCPNEGCAKNEN